MAKMVSKVEKLLAKANRAATQEEADTFFAGAQRIMTEHGIEETMLNLSSGEVKAEEVIDTDMVIKRSGYFESMVTLASEVARANDVRVLIKEQRSWGTEAGVRFVGFPSDISKAMMMYTALLAHCTRERRTLPTYIDAMPERDREEKNARAKAIAHWRHSFSLGYARRIGQRLYEMKLEAERAAKAADSTGTLLPALIDKAALVQAAADAMAGKPRAQRRRMIDGAGYRSGQEAANRADLGGRRDEVGGSRPEIGR